MVVGVARAAVPLLSLGLVVAALIGAAATAVTPSVVAVVAGFGAVAGVLVGTTWRWSHDRDVRPVEAARFAGAGMIATFALDGAATVAVGASFAVLAMLVAWLLAQGFLARRGDLPSAAAGAVGATRARPSVPETCDQLPVATLHELWEMLRTDDLPAGPGAPVAGAPAPPDPELVDLRSRVLDALARHDPEGYADWLRTEAPDNVASHVGRHEASGDETT